MSEALSDALAVGHQPPAVLSPQDEALFRAFQSNLLSLISHELRTPLMGVLNSLRLLDDQDAPKSLPREELVTMARQNAERLHRALVSLLDLASLESGTFHARLREVDLYRIVASRLETQAGLIRDRRLVPKVSRMEVEERSIDSPVLADPQKLARAVDLCLEAIATRAEEGGALDIRIWPSRIEIHFELAAASVANWQAAWTQAAAGFQSGVASPSSAFGGVLQSEAAFLTRVEEGLGSELLLVQQIVSLHQGRVAETHDGQRASLTIELPELSSEGGLEAVLKSRAFVISHELGSVSVVMIKIPEKEDAGLFAKKIKQTLFRATDAIYLLPERFQMALVLDDCKEGDSERVVSRMERELKQKLEFGVAYCPGDGLDPGKLIAIAAGRLRASGS